MDDVVVGSLITVALCIIIVGYIIGKVVKLINTTHSEDEQHKGA